MGAQAPLEKGATRRLFTASSPQPPCQTGFPGRHLRSKALGARPCTGLVRGRTPSPRVPHLTGSQWETRHGLRQQPPPGSGDHVPGLRGTASCWSGWIRRPGPCYGVVGMAASATARREPPGASAWRTCRSPAWRGRLEPGLHPEVADAAGAVRVEEGSGPRGHAGRLAPEAGEHHQGGDAGEWDADGRLGTGSGEGPGRARGRGQGLGADVPRGGAGAVWVETATGSPPRARQSPGVPSWPGRRCMVT